MKNCFKLPWEKAQQKNGSKYLGIKRVDIFWDEQKFNQIFWAFCYFYVNFERRKQDYACCKKYGWIFKT